MLAHELAHIRRHDYLVNLLQSSVETLLFYHPGVWWVSHVVRSEREHCCDDLAVAACGDAVLYARALTSIEVTRHHNPGLVLAISGSPLLARVRRLLGVREPASTSSGWVVAILTALMVSGAGVTGWLRLPAGALRRASEIAPRASGRAAAHLRPSRARPPVRAERARPARRPTRVPPGRSEELARKMADRQRALDEAVAQVNKAAADASSHGRHASRCGAIASAGRRSRASGARTGRERTRGAAVRQRGDPAGGGGSRPCALRDVLGRMGSAAGASARRAAPRRARGASQRQPRHGQMPAAPAMPARARRTVSRQPCRRRPRRLACGTATSRRLLRRRLLLPLRTPRLRRLSHHLRLRPPPRLQHRRRRRCHRGRG